MAAADEMKKMKAMTIVGVIFAVVGYSLILLAFQQEFLGPYRAIADGTSSRFLMTLKLGGIAHILVGICITLVVIIKALMMMPKKLGEMIK